VRPPRLNLQALFRHALACALANAMVWDVGAGDPAEVAVEAVPGIA